MSLAALLVPLTLAAAACATAGHGAATPVLLRYLPPEQGGPSVFPDAQVHGLLDLNGPCVRLQDPQGRSVTMVSSSGPFLRRDSAGFYVQTSEERLRHGSAIVGGGGWFDDFPDRLGPLEQPIPEPCRAGPFVVVTGMESFDPADEPPPVPRPPPVG